MPMSEPGEDGGDCPRCGATLTLAGWDQTVVGAHCERCTLTIALTGDGIAAHQLADQDWTPDEWEPRGSPYGPDPWG